VLKIILSNTSGLCRNLQAGEDGRLHLHSWNANMTIQSLRQCRSEGSFSNAVWQIVSAMDLKVKKWLTHSQFELREAMAPRHRTWCRIQALVGEHTQRQMQLTLESQHRINTYYVLLSELEIRFSRNDQEILCALGDHDLSQADAC